MAFLSNKTINCLNVHLALVNLLDQSFTVFGPVYLYTKGISIAGVLLIITALNLLRLPFRFLAFPVLRRWGLRNTVLIGATGYGLTFPVLSLVKGIDGWLGLYIAMYAIFNSMHWFCFHAFYSLAGEHENRGRHVAAAQALTTSFAAIAPLVSSFFILHEGFNSYFMLAFVLIILMWVTLLRCEPAKIADAKWQGTGRYWKSLGAHIQFLEAASSYPILICWLFTLYLYFGKITSIGGIVAFGVFAQTLYQLFLGSLVDKGRGRLILNSAEIIRTLVVAGRAFMPLCLTNVLALETVSAIGNTHHAAVTGTALYNAGKRAEHIIGYWLIAEMMWDIGTLIGAGGTALLLFAGVSLRHALLLAAPFMWIVWRVLSHYYRNHAYVSLAP